MSNLVSTECCESFDNLCPVLDPIRRDPRNLCRDFDSYTAMSEQDVNDTINYDPVVGRGYANRGAVVFKFYEDFGSSTLVDKSANIPIHNPGAGVIDAGDVATMGVPGEHAMIVWVAPRDMMIESHLELYSAGTSASNVHFLIRNAPGKPPVNPEGEQTIEVKGFNAAANGREYFTGSIAPFPITAGQEVMYWHGQAGAWDGMIGI